MPRIIVGDRAPDFTLQTETGETISLAAALERGPVVLIFYPMDNTPSCASQLCSVRNDAARYAEAGVTVYGINNGSASSHKHFIDRYDLTAPLLVDSNFKVASAYDAVLPLGLLRVVNRTVVGIARDGTIVFYQRGTPSTDDILAALAAAKT